MTGSALLDGILGAVTAILGAYGVWAGGRKALADARALKEPPPTPYEALANRVVALEESGARQAQDLSLLRTQVRRLAGVLTREVKQVIVWHDTGATGPGPEQEVRVIKDVITTLEHEQETPT